MKKLFSLLILGLGMSFGIHASSNNTNNTVELTVRQEVHSGFMTITILLPGNDSSKVMEFIESHAIPQVHTYGNIYVAKAELTLLKNEVSDLCDMIIRSKHIVIRKDNIGFGYHDDNNDERVAHWTAHGKLDKCLFDCGGMKTFQKVTFKQCI